ncbi:hypothetical protein V8C86DRAFT_2441950 [Haematococcus lacustris]
MIAYVAPHVGPAAAHIRQHVTDAVYDNQYAVRVSLGLDWVSINKKSVGVIVMQLVDVPDHVRGKDDTWAILGVIIDNKTSADSHVTGYMNPIFEAFQGALGTDVSKHVHLRSEDLGDRPTVGPRLYPIVCGVGVGVGHFMEILSSSDGDGSGAAAASGSGTRTIRRTSQQDNIFASLAVNWSATNGSSFTKSLHGSLIFSHSLLIQQACFCQHFWWYFLPIIDAHKHLDSNIYRLHIPSTSTRLHLPVYIDLDSNIYPST